MFPLLFFWVYCYNIVNGCSYNMSGGYGCLCYITISLYFGVMNDWGNLSFYTFLISIKWKKMESVPSLWNRYFQGNRYITFVHTLYYFDLLSQIFEELKLGWCGFERKGTYKNIPYMSLLLAVFLESPFIHVIMRVAQNWLGPFLIIK